MPKTYTHLGAYSDLVASAKKSARLHSPARPGKKTRELIRRALAFDPAPPTARSVRVEKSWTRDGVDGQLLTWSVGYGPRVEAYLLKPAGMKGKLPGVVALHDHGGFKYYGKEKIALGDAVPTAFQDYWFRVYYGGRAFANELARRGFAVLVPDCFAWGSRRFPLKDMPAHHRDFGKMMHERAGLSDDQGRPLDAELSEYAYAATSHEHTIQKYCHVLGTTFGGVVAYEDRVAARYLASRRDVAPGGVACIGLSGGGIRAVLMQATCDDIRASVVVGAMCAYEASLDHHIISHTWMIFPTPELSRFADWPDVASSRAPTPLLVQYDKDDELFTLKGMQAAHRRIASNYRTAGKAKQYTGEFYPGRHKFDAAMQESAFAWLKRRLS